MNHRDRVALGSSAVVVSRLGLGTAPIAGLYAGVSDEEATAVIDASVTAGIRLFDTAPLYGYGDGERRLGLGARRHPRHDMVIATKVGRLLRVPTTADIDPHEDIFPDSPIERPVFDFSYRGVHQSLEESLGRLGLDRVDVVHIHDPDDHFDDALKGAFRALDELRRAGSIGAVGAGMNQAQMLTAFARSAPFDCFLLAGRYTLLDQSGLAELLPECERRCIGVIIGGVYNSGILADPHEDPRYDYHVAPDDLVEKALAMERICDRHGVPMRAAAVQFPFGHPAVVSVVVGARSPAEVADAAEMLDVPIPPGLWRDLIGAGLLPEGIPTP